MMCHFLPDNEVDLDWVPRLLASFYAKYGSFMPWCRGDGVAHTLMKYPD